MLAFPFFIVLVAFALIASIFPAMRSFRACPYLPQEPQLSLPRFWQFLNCVIREFTMPAVQVVLWLWLHAGFGNAHREWLVCATIGFVGRINRALARVVSLLASDVLFFDVSNTFLRA